MSSCLAPGHVQRRHVFRTEKTPGNGVRASNLPASMPRTASAPEDHADMKRHIGAIGATGLIVPPVALMCAVLLLLLCAAGALGAGGGARGGPIVFGANEDQPKF